MVAAVGYFKLPVSLFSAVAAAPIIYNIGQEVYGKENHMSEFSEVSVIVILFP